MGIFETNSSSTHKLIVVPKSIYKQVKKGEIFIDYINSECPNNIKTYTFDEVKKQLSEEEGTNINEISDDKVYEYAYLEGYMSFDNEYDEYGDYIECDAGDYMAISYYAPDY